MSSNRFFPQMDSLRAVAVLGVLVHHWYSPRLPTGPWGVYLFFVISGYLITRSLFQLRDQQVGLRLAATVFFVRRARRLFPAYYVLILIGLALFPPMRDSWPWYAGYLSNVLLSLRADWIPLTPTWSLAVEEQFYLVWFFVVMLVALRRFKLLLLGLVLLAPVCRCVVLLNGSPFSTGLLWVCCDALAVGALLCVWEREGFELPRRAGPIVAAAFLAVVALCWNTTTRDPLAAPVSMTVIAFASGYLVWRTREGFTGPVGALLGWQPLVYIGQISYGIYLYHMVTPHVTAELPFLWRVAHEGHVGFAWHVTFTLAVAMLSYHLIEVPIRYGVGRKKPAVAA